MEPKILRLTEAFSMQPESYTVCKKEMDYSHFPGNDKPHEHKWNCIKEIKSVQIGKYEWIYVGYNFNDQKIFEIQSKSVNVFYDESSGNR